MSKSRPKTRWNLIVILIIAGSFSYAGFKYFSRSSQPANVMVIEPTPLTYGQTTISGGLHQDAGGNFVLVLPDRRIVTLDVKGVDQLDGSPVTISGILSPTPLSMVVQKITVTQ